MSEALSSEKKLDLLNRYLSIKAPGFPEFCFYRNIDGSYEIIPRIVSGTQPGKMDSFVGGKTKEEALKRQAMLLNVHLYQNLPSFEVIQLFLEVAGETEDE